MRPFPPTSLSAGPPLHATDEAHLLDFLRHSSVILLSLGEDGSIQYANSTFTTKLGYGERELLQGLNLFDVIAPVQRDDWRALFQQVIEGQAIREVDAVLLPRKGGRLAVRGEMDRVAGPDGASIVRGLFRDVGLEHAAAARTDAMQERFRTVAEVLLEGIGVLDSAGNIEYLNGSAQDILGVSRDEVLGRRFLDCTWHARGLDGTPISRDDHPALMAIRTGEPQPELIHGVTSAALTGMRWLAVSSRPLVSAADGRVYGSVSSFRDVTARMEAEAALKASEKRFATLASEAPVGIFHADPDGACLFINEAFSRLSGLTPEEARGEGWRKALHPADSDRVLEGWAGAAESRQPFREEYRLVRPDGSCTWVGGMARALIGEDDQVEGYLGSVMDISDRREAERIKDEMIALVSHELRGPLSAVRGGLRYLGEHMGRLPPEARRYHTIARRNTEYLTRLTQDLLDIEKLESGRIRLNTADVRLSDVLARASEIHASRAEDAGVGLHFAATDILVRADADRLLQVLGNLISNALKFSPPDTTVRVRAAVFDGVAEVTVVDEGRGIPPDFLEAVFDRFIQVEPGDSGEGGGAGLGLAICRALVREMRGSIRVESAPGMGSRFSFTLPLSDAPTS